jgi:uncharacterized protein YjbI with pentapeptide repeats
VSRTEPVQSPDLPELEQQALIGSGVLELSGALVEDEAHDPMGASLISIVESELRGVVLDAGDRPGLTLRDVILRDCGLSNLDGREGAISRVEVHRSQLVGFGASRARIRDLRVRDSSLQLASFALARVQNAVFEQVNLTEASFLGARLEGVEFIDCRLPGADFRDARLTGCAIRGCSLEGIVGIDSLRGVRMPWVDILASAEAMAAALGIAVESG